MVALPTPTVLHAFGGFSIVSPRLQGLPRMSMKRRGVFRWERRPPSHDTLTTFAALRLAKPTPHFSSSIPHVFPADSGPISSFLS